MRGCRHDRTRSFAACRGIVTGWPWGVQGPGVCDGHTALQARAPIDVVRPPNAVAPAPPGESRRAGCRGPWAVGCSHSGGCTAGSPAAAEIRLHTGGTAAVDTIGHVPDLEASSFGSSGTWTIECAGLGCLVSGVRRARVGQRAWRSRPRSRGRSDRGGPLDGRGGREWCCPSRPGCADRTWTHFSPSWGVLARRAAAVRPRCSRRGGPGR